MAKSASVQTSSHQSTLGCRPTSMSELTAKFHAHPLNLLSARPLSSVRMGPCSQPAREHFGIASNNAEVTIFLFLGRCGQSHGNAGFFFPGWRQPMADTLLRARWPLKLRGFGRKLSLFLSIDTAQRIQDLSPRAAVLLGLCSY